MSEAVQVSELFFVVICLASVLLSLGLFHRTVRQILTNVCAPINSALQEALDWTEHRIGTSLAWIKVFLAGRENEKPINFIIGAVFYTTMFVLLLSTDIFITTLTLANMFEVELDLGIDFNFENLIGLGFISAGVYQGAVLCDLMGLTNIGPWDRVRGIAKGMLWVSTIAFLTLTILITGALGYYRSFSLTDPIMLAETSNEKTGEASPIPLSDATDMPADDIDEMDDLDSTEKHIVIFIFSALPILIVASTVGAGIGPVMLVEYLLPIFLMGGVIISAFIARIGLKVLSLSHNVLWGLFDMAISYVLSVCVTIARPVATILERKYGSDSNEITGNQGGQLQSQVVLHLPEIDRYSTEENAEAAPGPIPHDPSSTVNDTHVRDFDSDQDNFQEQNWMESEYQQDRFDEEIAERSGWNPYGLDSGN